MSRSRLPHVLDQPSTARRARSGAGLVLLAPLCAAALVGCGSSAKVKTSTGATTPSTVSTVTVTAPGSSTQAGAGTSSDSSATTTTATHASSPTTASAGTAGAGTAAGSASTTATTSGSGGASGAASASGSSTSHEDLQSTIPATTFTQAGQAAVGAGVLPAGVKGSVCPGEYVTGSGAVSHAAADGAYAVAGGGLSLTCEDAAGLASDYLKKSGVNPGSSTTPPQKVQIDGATCGNYWYKPAGDEQTPAPYVTCNLVGATVTFYAASSD